MVEPATSGISHPVVLAKGYRNLGIVIVGYTNSRGCAEFST